MCHACGVSHNCADSCDARDCARGVSCYVDSHIVLLCGVSCHASRMCLIALSANGLSIVCDASVETYVSILNTRAT